MSGLTNKEVTVGYEQKRRTKQSWHSDQRHKQTSNIQEWNIDFTLGKFLKQKKEFNESGWFEPFLIKENLNGLKGNI